MRCNSQIAIKPPLITVKFHHRDSRRVNVFTAQGGSYTGKHYSLVGYSWLIYVYLGIQMKSELINNSYKNIIPSNLWSILIFAFLLLALYLSAYVCCVSPLEPSDRIWVGGDATLGHWWGGDGILLRVRQRREETSLGQDFHPICECTHTHTCTWCEFAAVLVGDR